MIFILLFVYILLCTLIYVQNKRFKAQYIIAVFLPLSLLMAYRSPIMTICVDTYAYIDIFELSFDLSWDDILSFDSYKGSEVGYWIVNKLFSLISEDYLHFQIFMSIITCGSVGFFIYKQIDNPILGIALYLGLGFYFISYNITRQMLVDSIFALCIPIYASRNKILFAVALSLLFSMIHTTSLLYLLCPLFLYTPRKIEKFLPIFLGLLAVFLTSILQFARVVFDKYESYYEDQSGHEFGLGISSIAYLIILIISVIAFYSNKLLSQQDKMFSLFSMFSIICIFLGLKMNYMERIGLLFFPFVILTVVRFGECIANKRNRNIYFAFMTISMLIFFILRSPEYILYV